MVEEVANKDLENENLTVWQLLIEMRIIKLEWCKGSKTRGKFN